LVDSNIVKGGDVDGVVIFVDAKGVDAQDVRQFEIFSVDQDCVLAVISFGCQ